MTVAAALKSWDKWELSFHDWVLRIGFGIYLLACLHTPVTLSLSILLSFAAFRISICGEGFRGLGWCLIHGFYFLFPEGQRAHWLMLPVQSSQLLPALSISLTLSFVRHALAGVRKCLGPRPQDSEGGLLALLYRLRDMYSCKYTVSRKRDSRWWMFYVIQWCWELNKQTRTKKALIQRTGSGWLQLSLYFKRNSKMILEVEELLIGSSHCTCFF